MVPNETAKKDILECIELGVRNLEKSTIFGQQETLMKLDTNPLKPLNNYKSLHSLSSE